MENQHKSINGYRDLSALEISLMNEIKAIEASIVAPDAFESIRLRYCQALHEAGIESNQFVTKLTTFEMNWQNAHTFLQTGFMWAVRAVAQPQPTTPEAKVQWHRVDLVTVGDDMLKDDDQLLVESSSGRSLLTGFDLKQAYLECDAEDQVQTYVRFLFLDKLPA